MTVRLNCEQINRTRKEYGASDRRNDPTGRYAHRRAIRNERERLWAMKGRSTGKGGMWSVTKHDIDADMPTYKPRKPFIPRG